MRIDKEKVKKLYLEDGLKAPEIAKKLGYNSETVKKCIQRNFQGYKDQYKHKVAVIKRKEALRAVNSEANRYITPRAFIKKNRTAYKTKENGDIVIDREIAPVVPWDMPRCLKNEYE